MFRKQRCKKLSAGNKIAQKRNKEKSNRVRKEAFRALTSLFIPTDFSLLPAGFRQVVEDHSNKPFEQRTETEKEELYEKIAEQLAMIADNYNFNSRYSSIPTTVPSSKTDSLFKPTSTPATAAVPPALGGECLETSVDPQSPVRPAVQLPVEPASGGNLAPPEVVVIPESPQPLPGSRSGSESPVVEGAVGGQAVADETLLSPTVSSKTSYK